jgi:ribonuclease J
MANGGGRAREGRKPAEQTRELVMVALGGLGEVGMNAYLYGLGPLDAREWLLVDLGITFPEGDWEPGVDVILPDLAFIEAERASLKGIVITHAHEDHVGAVLELWDKLRAPIFVTPFTAGMLKTKAGEMAPGLALDIRVVPVRGRFQAGGFDVELVNMAHSIPEVSALAIRTPLGTVFHTADWKLDAAPVVGAPTDEKRIAEIGAEGILAFVGDSTNAMREGRSPSETEVAQSLRDIVKQAHERVIVTTFASNVGRIKAIGDAARAARRRLVIAGRALHRAIQVGIDTGYLPKDFQFLDQQQYSYLRRDEIVCLSTGSQGEPRAALARLAQNEHPDISVDKGDLVIFSSRTIPGNEKAVGRIQNALALMGCEVLTDNEALVHVTGHPRRDELRQMYAWTKPRIAIPMHGEARHLREHAKLARDCGVSEVLIVTNGEIVRLAPGPAKIVDDAPVGRIYRDGRLLINAEDTPVRERRKLAAVGIIVVALALTKRGELLGEPQVALDGVPVADRGGEPMLDIVQDAVDGCLVSIPPARRKDTAMVTEAVRRSVRAAAAQAWGKKPIVKVLLNVVDTRG